MVSKDIETNRGEAQFNEINHQRRAIHVDDRENCVNDKFKIVFVVSIFFLAISLIAVASILAWAYVERERTINENARLHEPTRLYTSASAVKFYNISTEKPQEKKEPIWKPEEQRSAIPEDGGDKMHLFRVYDAINIGAVCLDGTPPAYYIRFGRGLGLNRWIIHFNGGAWCFDEKACLERSRGSLGSTKHLPASPPVIQGINSANGQLNPDFYDWNLVWIVYCDGASFTGDREQPVIVEGENIFFRGRRILDAVITDLASHGILNAEGIILTGSSAGSMTAMFAVDRLAEQLPNVPMHVLSDAGFFIETQQLGGKNVGAMFKKIYEMQNSSGGLNQDCIRKFGMNGGWKCFLPQHTFKFIKHPVFILNAAYDVWAILYFVGINCKFPSVAATVVRKRRDSFKDSTELEADPYNLSNSGQTIFRLSNNTKKRRDISGFEILPYFRKETAENDEAAQAKSAENAMSEANAKKSEVPQSQINGTGRNEEKRYYEPRIGDSDQMEALNEFSVPEYLTDKSTTSQTDHEESDGARLHLNIEKSDDNVLGDTDSAQRQPTATLEEDSIVRGAENMPSNVRQESLDMNPLANSVDAMTNVADNVQKNKMDKETIGLLNEVFKKLKSLMPKKNISATALKKQNATIEAKMKNLSLNKNQPNTKVLQHQIETNKQNKSNNLKHLDLLHPKELQPLVKNVNIHNKTSSELLKQEKEKKQLDKILKQQTIHISDFFKRVPNVSAAKNRDNVIGVVKNKRSAGIVKEYINILRSDPPECTTNQMIHVMQYRNAMLQATSSVKTTPSAGLFLVSCIQHSLSLFDETWTGVTIKQKSIQQAFGDWYYGRGTNHHNIDGVYPSNPSCP